MPEIDEFLSTTNIVVKQLRAKSGKLPVYSVSGPEDEIRKLYEQCFSDELDWGQFLQEYEVSNESAGSKNSFIVVVPDMRGYNAFGVDTYEQAVDEAEDYEYAWIIDASSLSINVTAQLGKKQIDYADGVYIEDGDVVTPEPKWSRRNPGIGVICVADKGGPEITAFSSKTDIDFKEFKDNRKVKTIKLK